MVVAEPLILAPKDTKYYWLPVVHPILSNDSNNDTQIEHIQVTVLRVCSK